MRIVGGEGGLVLGANMACSSPRASQVGLVWQVEGGIEKDGMGLGLLCLGIWQIFLVVSFEGGR